MDAKKPGKSLEGVVEQGVPAKPKARKRKATTRKATTHKKKAVRKKTTRKASGKGGARRTTKRTKKAAPPATTTASDLEISLGAATAFLEPTAIATPHDRLDQHELAEALDALSGLLAPYGRLLDADLDPELGYGLKLPPDENGDRHFFGGVRIEADRARFSLPPLTWFPQLLQLVSEELLTRLHDGQHFLFERADPALLTELADLTRACYEHLREEERV